MAGRMTGAEETYKAVDSEREVGRARDYPGFAGKFLSALDYLFVLRPMILIPVWLFLLLGYHFGARSAGLSYSPFLPSLKLGATFLAFTGLVGGIYIMNQIADRVSDARNRKCFFIADGIISLRRAWLYIVLLYLAALAVSAFFGWEYRILIVASILLGYLYNMRPFHFKGRAFLDIASNAVGNGMLNFAIGWAAIAPLSVGEGAYIHAVPYMLAVAGVFTNTTVADMEGDLVAGERTTALFMGRRASGVLALLFMTASAIVAYMVSDWFCLSAVGLSLPLFAVALISDRVRWYMVSYKLTTFIFALAAGVLFWWFVPILIGSILLTKWYYRLRFNLKYPF